MFFLDLWFYFILIILCVIGVISMSEVKYYDNLFQQILELTSVFSIIALVFGLFLSGMSLSQDYDREDYQDIEKISKDIQQKFLSIPLIILDAIISAIFTAIITPIIILTKELVENFL